MVQAKISRPGKDCDKYRNQWVKLKLSEISDGLRILDAGAGECQYKSFCKHLDYVSQDLSLYDGLGDNAGLQTRSWNLVSIDIKCDIVDIPVPSESFDIVLCTEVLEHVPDPVAAVKEL